MLGVFLNQTEVPSVDATVGVTRSLMDVRDQLMGYANPNPRTTVMAGDPNYHIVDADPQLEEIIKDLRDAVNGARSGFRTNFIWAGLFDLVFADSQLCNSLYDLRTQVLTLGTFTP
jgi:hypothetical protein